MKMNRILISNAVNLSLRSFAPQRSCVCYAAGGDSAGGRRISKTASNVYGQDSGRGSSRNDQTLNSGNDRSSSSQTSIEVPPPPTRSWRKGQNDVTATKIQRSNTGTLPKDLAYTVPEAQYQKIHSSRQVNTTSASSSTRIEMGNSSVVTADPTWVPRNPGVKDGPWNETDLRIVESAVQDAETAIRISKIDKEGFVMLGRSAEELSELVMKFGQPRFRGKQLLDGLLGGAHSINDIPVIPKQLKKSLKAAGVRTGRSIIHHSVEAPDGTRKFLLQQKDGRVVECVGIPVTASEELGRQERLTVCVSSQVGCPMRCTFCATGKGGFARNLSPHEILDQVMTVQEAFQQRVSNVVFMGMGEPLLNIQSVKDACKLINEQLGISAYNITISTVGIPQAIYRLGQAKLRATLAVSIHAPNQALREKIIPSAKAYPLEALMQDCVRYYDLTGRRVTFEVTLLAGVNDQDEHAKELAALLKRHRLMSHVNVIAWNPVDESEFKRPSGNRVMSFKRILDEAGIPTSIRMSRGLEAAAACGQLRNQHQKDPLKLFAVPT
ncbi:hypothetical protein CEUSTIGMA_g9130.t1 [Chlamydomonas eustigma]|uniref:Radical SAM core domain-containing protein n=1 Tax=Chlamydomonas eustigma TaxID=1157962 RepID=A0A250XFL4_9CHLO|nr:hypothetical protein CEUSTIGMA_g9130.t1 [Chlamydomonas eustigma]|eukprot:GAX81702.1 hypothetical protein CEUSTIGMA_g9130.t1 [Chlamydomonas eustigma]